MWSATCSRGNISRKVQWEYTFEVEEVDKPVRLRTRQRSETIDASDRARHKKRPQLPHLDYCFSNAGTRAPFRHVFPRPNAATHDSRRRAVLPTTRLGAMRGPARRQGPPRRGRSPRSRRSPRGHTGGPHGRGPGVHPVPDSCCAGRCGDSAAPFPCAVVTAVLPWSARPLFDPPVGVSARGHFRVRARALTPSVLARGVWMWDGFDKGERWC